MTTVLLISDNPLFIRRAVEFLADAPAFEVRVCLNSTGIFEAYLQIRPSLIILDNGSLLPVSSILRHFASYHWDCSFLVAGKPRDGFTLPGLTYIDMEKASLLRALERWQKACVPAKPPVNAVLACANFQESRPLQLDVYYLMLSLCTVPDAKPPTSDTMNRLQQQLTAIGETEVCCPLQNDILVLMKKSTMRAQGAFQQVHSIICKSVDTSYASLFCEELRLDELDSALTDIMHSAPLGCFFASQSIDFRTLTAMRKEYSFAAVLLVHSQLLAALFAGRPDTLQDNLRKWYLGTLKPSFALSSLQTSEDWLYFFEQTLFQFFADANAPSIPRGSVENRYTLISYRWSTIYQKYTAAPFLPIVQSCVLLVLQKYSDENLSLDSAAKELGYSKAYVSRIFRTQTGITFVDFLQQLRVECARSALRSTTDSVRSIAQAIGYADAQYFSRVFQRHIGVYPTEYRTLCMKEADYAGTDSR